MALANDDDVIKTFPSDRADQPLRISVLPRRPRRDRSVANAHGPDAPDEGSAIRAVAVVDQVAWRLVPAGQWLAPSAELGSGARGVAGELRLQGGEHGLGAGGRADLDRHPDEVEPAG